MLSSKKKKNKKIVSRLIANLGKLKKEIRKLMLITMELQIVLELVMMVVVKLCHRLSKIQRAKLIEKSLEVQVEAW